MLLLQFTQYYSIFLLTNRVLFFVLFNKGGLLLLLSIWNQPENVSTSFSHGFLQGKESKAFQQVFSWGLLHTESRNKVWSASAILGKDQSSILQVGNTWQGRAPAAVRPPWATTCPVG